MTVVSSSDSALVMEVPPPVVPISREEKMKPIIKNKKKKSGPFSFFRAALVALGANDSKKKQKCSATPSVAVVSGDKEARNNENSDGNWKKIVGSMRPLHLQTVESPPSSPAPNATDLPGIRSFSPSPTHSSSSGSMSQYASASNLQALADGEEDEEEDDPDVVFDAICADELMDSKAEMFIAQFYQQMKMHKHHYNY